MPATLSDLRLRAKRRADMENSSFVADAEWNDYLNEGLAELHEIMTNKYEDYIVSSASLTLANGGSAVTLPADFFRVRGVDVTYGGYTYTLKPFMFRERNRLQSLGRILYGRGHYMYQIVGNELRIIPDAQGALSLTLWYIPEVTTLGQDWDELNVAYASGWERYIVLYAAIKALQKEESDVSSHFAELSALLGRIQSSAQRSAGDPKRIVDTRYTGSPWRGWS